MATVPPEAPRLLLASSPLESCDKRFLRIRAFILIVQSSLPGPAAVLSALSALGAGMDLIFRSERAAHAHHVAGKSFGDLAAKLERWDPTPKSLRRAKEARLKIDPDPPQVARVLVELMAHNEEARSRGVSETELVPLSAFQRIFGHCGTFGMRKIEMWRAANGGSSTSSIDQTEGNAAFATKQLEPGIERHV